MDGDRRQSEPGRNGAEAPDNVVRLPCEWLGSRDELVPIGHSAPSADGESVVDMPPAAEDFWGEASATVQDALQAPAGYGQDHLRGPGATKPRPTEGASAQARLRIRSHRSRPPRRSAVALGATALASAALVASIIGFATSSRSRQNPARPTANPPAAAEALALTNSLAASLKALARGTEQATRRAETSLRSKPRRVFARHERPSRHHEHRSRGTGSDTHQTFVSSPTPATTSPGSTQGSHGSSQSTTDAGGASVSQAATPNVSSAPSGPTGRVALIGAGTSPSG